MDKWMTTETTTLTEHPNDPAKAEVSIWVCPPKYVGGAKSLFLI